MLLDIKLVIFNIFLQLNYSNSLHFALTCHKTYEVFESDYL